MLDFNYMCVFIDAITFRITIDGYIPSFYLNKKKHTNVCYNLMASTKGFEPLTARLEGVCSIQLSYVDFFINCSNNITYKIK